METPEVKEIVTAVHAFVVNEKVKLNVSVVDVGVVQTLYTVTSFVVAPLTRSELPRVVKTNVLPGTSACKAVVASVVPDAQEVVIALPMLAT